jgi:glycosyltransferase involved in cell wall biosynthesis
VTSDARAALLVFNLATDADDPILGFTTGWLNRLAGAYAHVDVITMRVGRLEVAPNVRVYSVGKEHGASDVQRALTFYSTLNRLLNERRYQACFAHMMPLFAAMGAPLLKLRGVPLTLWYTHRQAHRILKLATAASARVVTAAPDSFPLPTPKLRVLGHGIDTDFFSPGDAPPSSDAPAIVHVARLMPIKHQTTLVRALTEVPDARAVFVGDVPPTTDRAYRSQIEALARDLGVGERVTLTGDLARGAVRDQYRAAAAAVNLSPPGLFDKAALEAMSTAIPTIVSSPAFDPLLGEAAADLRIDAPDDAAALADRLRRLLAQTPAQRARLGDDLRARVVASHGLDGLIARLVSVLRTGEPA